MTEKSRSRFSQTRKGAKIFTQLVAFVDSMGVRGFWVRMIILKNRGVQIYVLLTVDVFSVLPFFLRRGKNGGQGEKTDFEISKF